MSFEVRVHLLRAALLVAVSGGAAWLGRAGYPTPSAVLLGLGLVAARPWLWPLLAGLAAIARGPRRSGHGPFEVSLPWGWAVGPSQRPEHLALEGPGGRLEVFLVPAGREAALLERLAAALRARMVVRSERPLTGWVSGRAAQGVRLCASRGREVGVLELLSRPLEDGRAVAVMTWRDLWAPPVIVHHAADTLGVAPVAPAP